MNLLRILFVSLFLYAAPAGAQVADDILGRWKATGKTLTIEIYKAGAEYRGRILHFEDHHSDTPEAERTDEKNPDPALRSRKIIGLDMLSGLRFDAADKQWEDGAVYHPGSGKTYSVETRLEGGRLVVRAYKGVEMLGKTYYFVRQAQ